MISTFTQTLRGVMQRRLVDRGNTWTRATAPYLMVTPEWLREQH